MILVTGATGKVGRNVVELLVTDGVKVRALTRNPDSARIPEGAEVVAGDLMADPDGLGDALHGVDAVFLNAAAFLDLAGVGPQAATFLALAKQRGVGRVVLLTSGTVTDGLPADQQPSVISRMHKTIEDAVETSGLAWTLLRPGEFMSNSLEWAAQIRATGIVRAPYGEARWAPIHERDVAEVAVRALTEAGHAGVTHKLSGPETISYHDRARIIGEATGRPVRLSEITPDIARQAMVMGGVPPEVASALLTLTALGVEQPEPVLPTVRELTGQAGRTFAQWARENASVFRTA